MSATDPGSANPLPNLDQWEDFLEGRYKEGKSESDFRQYDAEANPGVAEFYRTNHEKQTVDYVLGKEKQYFGLARGQKTIWEAACHADRHRDAGAFSPPHSRAPCLFCRA
jgi:inositol oxygenase